MFTLHRVNGRWFRVFLSTDDGGGNGGGEGSAAGGTGEGSGNAGTGQGTGSGNQGNQNNNSGETSNGNQGGNSGSQNNQQESFPRAYVQDLRKEAQTYRERAQAAERELGELKTHAAAKDGQIRDLTVGAAVKDALASAGALNAAVLLKAGVVDISKLELGTDGLPIKEKLDLAIEEAKKASPELFGTPKVPNADGNAGGGSAGKPDISKMSMKEIAELGVRAMAGERIEL